MQRSFSLLVLLLAGCGGMVTPSANSAPVALTGTITRAGQPVSDVIFNLQPTGPGSMPSGGPVKDGKFETTANPGKYTYFFSEAPKEIANAKKAFEAIPAELREGSMDRQIEVVAGQPLDIQLK